MVKLYKFLFFSGLVLFSQVVSAQNLMADWDGGETTGSGSEPNNFGWDCSPSITWAEANVFGVRFQDDVSYTYNGGTLTGRVLYVRWDGVSGTTTSSVFSYPADLEACKTYVFKAKIAWHNNASAPVYTYRINSTKDNSGKTVAKDQISVPAKEVLHDMELVFAPDETGTYYFTLEASSGVLGAIRDLSLVEYSGDPVLSVSKTELTYDSAHLSQSFQVNGYGLTEDITFSGPSGMTITPASITPEEAECPVSVTAAFDDAEALSDGSIEVTSGALSEVINIKVVMPPWMAPGTAEFATDGTWCWFQDPRAVYYEGEKKQTYTGWVTSDGTVQVGSYNHETGETTIHTLNEKFQVDDHNNPTFLIREDGRIVVAYSGHFYGPMRVLVSENPEDITSFGPEANFGNNVTYANPYQIGDSTVMFYRDGATWHPTMNVSLDGGVTWGTPQEFITRNGSQQRPYVKYTQDSNGGMHITFTTGHPRQEPANKIYYVYYKNKKFYKADGTLIKSYNGATDALDIDAGEPEVVYDASLGKGWTWDIALDENEQPVILYAAFPDDLNHHYYYAYWDGSAWINNHIVNSGRWFPQTPEGAGEPEPNYSGGMTLDPNDPSIVYLSKQVDGVFEIFKYKTSDKGESWETEQITKNTPADVVNVRPVIPRGHLPGSFDVMWMRGKYVTYANYLTSVMYYSPNTVNANLDSIYIGGKKFDNFHPDTLYYQIELPEETNRIPNVVGFSSVSSSKVEVTSDTSLPGQVTISVTAEGGQNKQYIINFTIAASPLDIRKSSGFNLFPNPTKGILNMDLAGIDKSYRYLSIRSVHGGVIWRERMSESNHTIDLSHYARGVYLLELSNGKEKVIHRVIKR